MISKAVTVEEYLENIPEEKRAPFQDLRKTILENLPEGFQEEMSYGMIGYVVPLHRYPAGYHCNPELPLPFVNIASQKNFIAVYHMGLYANKALLDWFIKEYGLHSSRKLDMGKSCIRFKNPKDIPFSLIGELMQKITMKEWINIYESQTKTPKR